MITQETFKKRRNQVFDKMLPNSVAIVFSSPKYPRTRDVYYPYRQNSNFYYLTGFAEPKAIAVLMKTDKTQQYVLFNQSFDALFSKWNGTITGQEGSMQQFGADRSFPIQEFEQKILELLIDKKYLYYTHSCYSPTNDSFNDWLNAAHHQIHIHMQDFTETYDLAEIIHELRLIKTSEEIQAIKKAAKITSNALIKTMKLCHAGVYEYQLAAELIHEFHYNHATEAFPAIVAGGINACTLHYEQNNHLLNNNELVLIDTGCEYQYYASDISRTFPINGKFNPTQRLLYELVLKTQLAVIRQIRPNISFHLLQETAIRNITEGLCQLNLLSGDIEKLIEEEAYKPFYMHQVSHWMGMDTHDVGNYKINDQWRPLQTGMVLSVEPGLYISEEIKGIDKKWKNIGIRIEDDILVTEQGCQVLTSTVPKTIRMIENLYQ